MNIEQRIERASVKLKGEYSKEDISKVSKTLSEVDEEALMNKESVKIAGFGSLVVVPRKMRKGVIPRTTTPLIIPEHYSIRFIPAGRLKKNLNKG